MGRTASLLRSCAAADGATDRATDKAGAKDGAAASAAASAADVAADGSRIGIGVERQWNKKQPYNRQYEHLSIFKH